MKVTANTKLHQRSSLAGEKSNGFAHRKVEPGAATMTVKAKRKLFFASGSRLAKRSPKASSSDNPAMKRAAIF